MCVNVTYVHSVNVYSTLLSHCCALNRYCVFCTFYREADSDDDDIDASLPSCLRECPRIIGADVHRNSYNNECTIGLEGT